MNHKKSSKHRPVGVCGLYNLGNTCYMNCVLQCLMHSNLFSKYCLDYPTFHSDSYPPGNEIQFNNHISLSLVALTQDLHSSQYSICTPRAVKTLIGLRNVAFKGSDQNDASELLMFLLDALDSDLRGTTLNMYKFQEVIQQPTPPLIMTISKENEEIGQTKQQGEQLDENDWIKKSSSDSSKEGSPRIKRKNSKEICSDNEKLTKPTLSTPHHIKRDHQLKHATPTPTPLSVSISQNTQQPILSKDDGFQLTLPHNSETKKQLQSNIISQSQPMIDSIELHHSDVAYGEYLAKNKSIITELFYGMMLKRTQCPCGYNSDKCEPFATLPLTIPLPKELHGFYPIFFVGKEGVPHIIYLNLDIRPNVQDLINRISQKVGKPIVGVWCDVGRTLHADLEHPPKFLDLRGSRGLVAYEKVENGKLVYIQIEVNGTIKKQPIPLLLDGSDIDGRLGCFGVTNDFKVSKKDGNIVIKYYGTDTDAQKLTVCIKDELPQTPLLNPNSVSLDWCMKDFFKESVLEKGNEWKCDGCGKKVNAYQKCIIEFSPNVLIVHLKRFRYVENWRIVKDNQLVTFPFELDLSQYSSEGLYNLVSVVNHRGTMSGGHYYSYCKLNNEWYIFNDDSVTEISANSIVTNNAFLLFYEKAGIREE
ncbi:Ubiquitin carboxyl-terminal hydrolase [Entamoeba marina]